MFVFNRPCTRMLTDCKRSKLTKNRLQWKWMWYEDPFSGYQFVNCLLNCVATGVSFREVLLTRAWSSKPKKLLNIIIQFLTYT